MKGVRRVLLFDILKPRIFTRRLIKVAVNAKIALHWSPHDVSSPGLRLLKRVARCSPYTLLLLLFAPFVESCGHFCERAGHQKLSAAREQFPGVPFNCDGRLEPVNVPQVHRLISKKENNALVLKRMLSTHVRGSGASNLYW